MGAGRQMDDSSRQRRAGRIAATAIAAVAGAFLLVEAIGAASAHSRAGVTITIEGPNQWTDSGRDFGKPWDVQVARFEKANPGVTVKTIVLDQQGFGATEATQLAAGTAPDLVFNQASFNSHAVLPLDGYLKKPNPYAPGRPKWIDWFIPAYYGFGNSAALSPPVANPAGHLYWAPFNLVGTALYVNEDALKRAGVRGSISTWQQLATANAKLKAHGIAALTMDNSVIGTYWTVSQIFDMLLRKYVHAWNHFTASGKLGISPALTVKDLTWAIKTGKFNVRLPEVAASLNLSKQLFMQFTVPNWSGIKGLSGAVVDLRDFLNQKGAMAWGVDFGYSQIAHAPFKVGTIPFPTITKASSPLSTNAPAESGVSTGGTSYMIPSSTKGDHLRYAIRFLQFMSAPKYVRSWLQATGGIPAIRGIRPPANTSGFLKGAWAKTQQTFNLFGLDASGGSVFNQTVEAYFLGSSDLKSTLSHLQDYWNRAADYQIQQNNWGKEGWAK